MKTSILAISLTLLAFSAQAQHTFITKFEESEGKETVTYEEGMAYFKNMADTFKEISLYEMGPTDSGEPLHLLLYNPEGGPALDSAAWHDKHILFINNGIHPGEPDGIDASMLLLRNLVSDENAAAQYKDVIIAIIPFFNIGGALNRNSTSRVNQNGPEAYGFRGNAQNYNLNRDFIKNDALNTRSFTEIFHLLAPQLYVETHVSNGADYQYTMTLLPTQANKLGGSLGNYLRAEFQPELYDKMADKSFEMTPYVNVWGTVPDSGYVQFMDWPRYSSGYVGLFGTLGFITETHMLKPYDERVHSTLAFLESTLEMLVKEGDKIKSLQQETLAAQQQQKVFPISWEVDKDNPSSLLFKGYEASYIDSKVTGQKRLFYDQSKPFTKSIDFYNNYVVNDSSSRPAAYIIPQGWHEVIALLKLNGVAMEKMDEDQELEVEVYHIADFETLTSPFEGHYMHFNTSIEKSVDNIRFRKGDYRISTAQPAVRYLIETLEPQAPDSFFNWNFFDTMLQKKEGYSAYVFEDLAEEILNNDAALKQRFETKVQEDEEFAENSRAQLDYIYENSVYAEKEYMRYPVFRMMHGQE